MDLPQRGGPVADQWPRVGEWRLRRRDPAEMADADTFQIHPPRLTDRPIPVHTMIGGLSVEETLGATG